MSLADGFVIGVEEIAVVAIVWMVTRHMREKNEGFEKPGRMRAMPFCGARIGHRLDALIFRAQRLGKALGLGADGGVTGGKRLPGSMGLRRPCGAVFGGKETHGTLRSRGRTRERYRPQL